MRIFDLINLFTCAWTDIKVDPTEEEHQEGNEIRFKRDS